MRPRPPPEPRPGRTRMRPRRQSPPSFEGYLGSGDDLSASEFTVTEQHKARATCAGGPIKRSIRWPKFQGVYSTVYAGVPPPYTVIPTPHTLLRHLTRQPTLPPLHPTAFPTASNRPQKKLLNESATVWRAMAL